MYDIVAGIIDHNWMTGDSSQQYIFFVCCSLIIIFTVYFLDLFKGFIRSFIRR